MQKRLRMSENPGGARELDVEFRRRQKERERERGGGVGEGDGSVSSRAEPRWFGAATVACGPGERKVPFASLFRAVFFLSFLLARLLLRCVVPFPSSSTTATLPRAFRERYRFPRESHSVDSKREDGNEDG